MANPKPTNPKELSAVLGISQKAVCKSIKKLADAGIIQKGEFGGRQRMFNVSGHEHSEPDQEPDPDKGGHDERFRRIEAMMEVMLSDIASLKSAIPMPEMVHIETQMPHIVPILRQTLPAYAPQVEPTIIASSLAFNNSKQAMQEFHELFGVQVPIGSDIDKVTEMVRRKKAGQIEHVKSPLRYLEKVTPLVTVPTSATTQPIVSTCRPIPEMVDMKKIELAKKADEMWEKMGDGEKKPFLDHETRKERTPSKYQIPIETLARSEFKRQQLKRHGIQI